MEAGRAYTCARISSNTRVGNESCSSFKAKDEGALGYAVINCAGQLRCRVKLITLITSAPELGPCS